MMDEKRGSEKVICAMRGSDRIATLAVIGFVVVVGLAIVAAYSSTWCLPKSYRPQ